MIGHSLLRQLLLACIGMLPLLAGSQEGFPLDGTWRGQWGQSEDGDGTHVVIVMKWDGKTITGRINPGPNAINFSDARLEPSDWGVHIRAQAPDGEAIRIDGTLNDIGSYNRKVVGTWRQGDTEYAFSITRE